MEIQFSTTKMKKACSEEKQMKKQWGDRTVKKLKQRLAEFAAAATLADMRCFPGPRCHELKGKHQGELAVDLDHPRRLVFRPNHDPVPTKRDGGLDWSEVTSVCVLEVVDYH